MKIQTIHDPKIGAVIKHDPSANLPAVISALESECREFFGADALAEVMRASGAPGGLTAIAPMAFSLGFALGSKRGRLSPGASATSATAPKGASVSEGGSVKDFIARLEKETATVAGMVKLNKTRAQQGLPPLPITFTEAPKPSASAPPKKTFVDRVREKEATGLTKATAIGAAIKEFPELHREWLASGQTHKL